MKNHIPSYNDFVNESINEGSEVDPRIKKEAISRLSDFFGCAPGNLSKFKFDGKDPLKDLTNALNATSYEGAEAYYKAAIQMAKRDLGIHESAEVNEGKASELKPGKKYTSDYGEVTFIKLNPDRKTMELHSKTTGKIKTDISNAYNMVLIESEVNEGAVKAFEKDYKDMETSIKRGIGWIDPEYVADTWENSSDTIDYSLVKGEILKRLQSAGLLWHSDANGEDKGKQVKFSELGAIVMMY